MTDKERREYNHKNVDLYKEVDWKKWEHVLARFQPKGGERHGKNPA